MNLPNAQDAEQAIIGALMINPALIGQALIDAEDFYWPSTRHAYQAICGLLSESQELNPPAIHYRTEETGNVVLVTQLSDMLDAARGVISIRQEVAIVKEKARKRRIAKVAGVLQAGALNGECSLDLIQSGEEALAELRRSLSGNSTGFRPLEDLDCEAGIQYDELRRGISNAIPTGFTHLDEVARGGIQPGEMWVVASLTGRGKSSWALGAARYQAEQNIPVAFVSREMSDYENYTRMLSAASGIPMWRIRVGMFTDTYQGLCDWREPLKQLPMFFNSTTSSVFELRSQVKELVKAHGVKSLFVDYLQLLSAHLENKSRAQDVAAVSRTLKEIAMDNKIGVFALVQFNRLASHGERPELHHFAESGGIEKDASLALILDMNEQKDGEVERPCTMRIAKHRNGPLMSLKYVYQGDILTFKEA